MKLARYGRAGAERPGLIDDHGVLRDLSRVLKDISSSRTIRGRHLTAPRHLKCFRKFRRIR